ncbi:hypothetical protein PBRA_002322 [Plasmodiophora brassicae]|uniref:Uncharacterized protein n=1 Tax=Plasmodiophora brassicae TaxID=37360 RepID=A0A0G4J3D9_PLABS|nr:hypothetical protein PBRA_002322 [Plasmodiophora brassicae]
MRWRAEVDDLDVGLGVEEQVLRLQVAVDDVGVVAVLHAVDDLVEEDGGGLLVDPVVLDDEVEQFAAGRVLHDQEHEALRVDDLVQVDDVRVLQMLQDVYLAGHPLDIVDVDDPALLQDLDGDLDPRDDGGGSCIVLVDGVSIQHASGRRRARDVVPSQSLRRDKALRYGFVVKVDPDTYPMRSIVSHLRLAINP